MKNNWSRLLTLALALIMVLSCLAFVSCKPDNPVVPDDPDTPDTPDDPGTDENDYLMTIPKKSYGKTFTFLSDVGDDIVHELYFSSEDEALANTVDTAIYYRNERVAEHLGVTFASITSPGRWQQRADYINRIYQSYSTGEQDYQLASVYMGFASEGAIKGYYYDVNQIDAIDINSPWYVQSWLENTVINDHTYMILSDLSYSMWQNIMVMYFNKQIADELGIVSELYSLATSGELTWDYVMDKAEMALESDGNEVWDINDTYGFYLYDYSVRSLLVSFDIPLTRLNDDGDYEICIIDEDGRTETIWGAVHSDIHDNDFIYIPATTNVNDGKAMFMEDRLLFFPLTLRHSQDLRTMDGSFGILPMPKYDLEQDSYASISTGNLNIFIIPAQTNDPEFCGTVVDALSAESKHSVIPTYYETVLMGRTTKDEESIVVLDMVRQTLKYDFAYAHLTAIGTNVGTLYSAFGESLKKPEETSFTGYYSDKQVACETDLEAVLDAYWDVR